MGVDNVRECSTRSLFIILADGLLGSLQLHALKPGPRSSCAYEKKSIPSKLEARISMTSKGPFHARQAKWSLDARNTNEEMITGSLPSTQGSHLRRS
jgi:hypothetical protein